MDKKSQPEKGRESEMEGGRKEVELGMASSTTANLLESMETGTSIISTRWMYYAATR
jgi:hypothetical protein